MASAKYLLVVALAALCCGCSTVGRYPQLLEPAMTPPELKAGETAVITVRVSDRHNIIHRVEGVVREDPAVKLKLRDDGKAPDEKAGDGVWSLQVDAPFQAPAGQYHVDLTAYRQDGSPVPMRKDGQKQPLTATIPVAILNP
ncbi:MAG TPA: hypothetical protein PKO36_12575 [Candidatus Hydrogenedentes bacterium]|nr:hypothetical protein [Candidatus Hydrogenedentota bacterium]HOT50124.1 hypothetical protein [Candidatus Hydrogenedentota bacterium]HOV74299.1 hypothetical protein [Candidatus Hydrogenedentota bacterium]HPC15008.1 hypothetical protein [Candidatus Hydrogenedentota bacterium]HRT19131.1 hypothetical protein [Candidatus Hydrogenedentota bacterium]